jgi:hypothetical protein
MEGGHLVVQDLDGMPSASRAWVMWSNILLENASCVTFSGLFAEAEASDGSTDIGSSAYIHLDYSIDDGVTWVPLLHFAAAVGVFRPDRNLDGRGDASERALNGTGYLYSAVSQPLQGAAAISLRLSVAMYYNDEDAAFDKFNLRASSCSDPDTPLPPLQSDHLAKPILFFESFDTKARMVSSPRFTSTGSDYFGLTGGIVSDFGSNPTPSTIKESTGIAESFWYQVFSLCLAC